MTLLESDPTVPRLLTSAAGIPRHRRQDDLVGLARLVRLLGRGGAGFPVATKLAAMPRGRAVQVLVNGSESEPASHKDRALMRQAPDLVLNGALIVARALDTHHVTVLVHDPGAADSLARAIRERSDASRVRVLAHGGGFVSGEVRAAMRLLAGAPAVPPGRRVLPHEAGIGGAPTFASNVETFAQLGVLSSLGAEGFASVGSADEPGTTLLTLLGDVPSPGVVEVPTGLPLATLLPGQEADPRPVLIGGYHGSWITDVRALRIERPALRASNRPLNAGVIARLSHDTCALAEVVAVSTWLADQSAGQCGPCFFGLPAVARDVHALLRGDDPGAGLTRRVAQLPGRGACAHPDGAAMFVRTALTAMADEVDAHQRHGTCGRPWLRELPTGQAPVVRSAS